MIEQVITKKNMRLACSHVLQNKGSAGVDGMSIRDLYQYVQEHKKDIAASISQPVKLATVFICITPKCGAGQGKEAGLLHNHRHLVQR